MNIRPKLILPLTTFEKIIKVLSGLLIVIQFLYVFFMWNKLPGEVPTHFNAAGQVDGWGGKGSIWMFPVIGLGLYVMLSIIERFPNSFNFPFVVTEENAPRLYLEARRLLVILNFEITMFFGLVTWGIVQAAFGHDSFNIWFIPVFLIILFGTIGISIYRLFRVR